MLKALPIVQDSQALWVNVDLEAVVRKAEITAYEAAYLALALRRNIPLATGDDLLKRKAQEFGVELLL